MMSLRLHTRWKRADLAWLGFALVAHAALLLLPLGTPMNKLPSPQRLTLELVNWRATAEPSIAKESDSTPAPAPYVKPLKREPSVTVPRREAVATNATDPERMAETESAAAGSTTPDGSPDRLTAALLMNAAAQRGVPRGEAGSPQTLGVHTPRELPSNWQRGKRGSGMATDEPGLNIAMAPAETEIVDRWLDVQGAHNVVLTLPNGETVCGRALAWDPMQPLVEHIMMYRPCGGGGKRTFDMASRPTPRWSTAE